MPASVCAIRASYGWLVTSATRSPSSQTSRSSRSPARNCSPVRTAMARLPKTSVVFSVHQRGRTSVRPYKSDGSYRAGPESEPCRDCSMSSRGSCCPSRRRRILRPEGCAAPIRILRAGSLAACSRQPAHCRGCQTARGPVPPPPRAAS